MAADRLRQAAGGWLMIPAFPRAGKRLLAVPVLRFSERIEARRFASRLGRKTVDAMPVIKHTHLGRTGQLGGLPSLDAQSASAAGGGSQQHHPG